MSDRIYHDLRGCIDQYGIGFNETESQIEIALLKKLFTEASARMFMHLKPELEPVETIAARAGLDFGEASDLLAQMAKKGVTFPIKRDGVQYYAATPFLYGIYENISSTHSESPEFKEIAAMVKQYLENGFFPSGPTMRTVPINEGVGTSQLKRVASFENVKKIIEGKEKIGLIPCACSVQEQALQESSCNKNVNVCIPFDFYAEHVIEGFGKGRWISKEEALEIVKQAEKDGLVHQIAGDGSNVEGICNCCRDCCSSLRIVKLFPVPGELVLNNFSVSRDTESCVNCGVCIDRCPIDAFSQNEEMVTLSPERCIGCGLCSTTCSAGALSLKSKPEKDRTDAIPRGGYAFMRGNAEYEKDIERNRPDATNGSV